MDKLLTLLEDLRSKFEGLKAEKQFQSLSSLTIDTFREKKALFTGRDGEFKALYNLLREVSLDEKPHWASKINSLKEEVETFFNDLEEKINERKIAEKLSGEYFDLTLPALTPGQGQIHPLIRVEQEITELLACYGFEEVEGPEIEEEFYCFDALNIAPHHPARDMQDTFYTDNGRVLRTHTTSVQSRILERGDKIPIKVASPGRVYRNENIDATHTDMFHQYEGMWIDKDIVLAHLIELLTQVLKELYGRKRKVRVVQKYYPYTEPSIGMLISKVDGTGWSTVAGAGMVHQKVLGGFGLDSKKISGLAFGLGTTRLVAERYGYPNLRSIYQNDLRVLRAV